MSNTDELNYVAMTIGFAYGKSVTEVKTDINQMSQNLAYLI